MTVAGSSLQKNGKNSNNIKGYATEYAEELDTNTEEETTSSSSIVENQDEQDTTQTASLDMLISQERQVAQLEDLIQEEIDNQFNSLEIGTKINVEDGVNAYTSSAANQYKTFGDSGFFSSGEYEIKGIAVTFDGKLLGYIQDENEQGTNLSEFVNNICEENEISQDDAEVMLHIGNAGWVYKEDLVNESTISQDGLYDKTIEKVEYTVAEEDFKGDNIVIDTLDGDVTISIKDENGEYVNSGDIIEVDGNEYYVEEINVETNIVNATESDIQGETEDIQVETTEEETAYETETVQQDLIPSKSSNGNNNAVVIVNLGLAMALIGALGEATSKMIEARKNAKSRKNPIYIRHTGSREGFFNYMQYTQYTNEIANSRKMNPSNLIGESVYEAVDIENPNYRQLGQISEEEAEYYQKERENGIRYKDPSLQRELEEQKWMNTLKRKFRRIKDIPSNMRRIVNERLKRDSSRNFKKVNDKNDGR